MHGEFVTRFRKSSYSDQQGDCLEIALTRAGRRAIRDSKDPCLPVLAFGAVAWRGFVAGLRGHRAE